MRYTIVILITMLLNVYFAHGDDYGFYAPKENISCDIISMNMNAVYEYGRYTCTSGYYLPANADGCETCPTGGICYGGTFSFNANEFQGLVLSSIQTTTNNLCADNFPNRLDAIYTPNEHTCSAGQYMPANYDGCVACPADSYCSGGTYTFNETVPQGIEPCPNNWYSPTGSSSIDQCGRILHVGDNVVYLRSVKKTVPSLNIDIDNDEVADFFGNMTTLDVPMNINTERKLKIRFNNTTYSVYDDSVDLSLYRNE